MKFQLTYEPKGRLVNVTHFKLEYTGYFRHFKSILLLT